MHTSPISAPEGLTFSHREYRNDIITSADKSLALRVALAALPFISLYAPLALPLAVTMGSFRVYSNLSQLCTSYNPRPLQTALSIVALTATIFTPVVGFALTTSMDLLIELQRLSLHLQSGNTDKILESCIIILSNSTYLALLASGSHTLSILALTTQCLAESFYGLKEFGRENYLEATGHILMSFVRSSELLSQISQKEHPSYSEAITHNTSCQKNFEWIVPYESLPAVFQVDLLHNIVSKDLVTYLLNCQKIDGTFANEALKSFSSASIYIDCPTGGKHVHTIEIQVSSPSESPTFSWK